MLQLLGVGDPPYLVGWGVVPALRLEPPYAQNFFPSIAIWAYGGGWACLGWGGVFGFRLVGGGFKV